MCEPTTMAIAMGAAAGLQSIGQAQAGRAQGRLINQQYAQQSSELDDQTSAALNERARASRRERERIRVLTGEAGVAGNSFESLIMNSFMQQGSDAATLNKELNNRRKALEVTTKSQLAQVQIPTFLGSALQIGLGAASGYSLGGAIAGAGGGTTAALI